MRFFSTGFVIFREENTDLPVTQRIPGDAAGAKPTDS